jgi:hypothetical protein
MNLSFRFRYRLPGWYNDPIVVTRARGAAGRPLAVAFALVLVGSACLDLAPPPAEVGTLQLPTATATSAPTNTPTPEPTFTATSTVTTTATVTPTATPSFGFGSPVSSNGGGLGVDQSTGRLVVTPATNAPGSGTPVPGIVTVPTNPLTGGPGLPASGPGANLAPAASTEWGCDGDERMEFVPPGPHVGDKLFIFVTGARDRAFGLIIGPQLSGVQGANVQGGSGLKKQWEITPTQPGTYQYHFYGGPYPEHLCVSGTVEVSAAVSINAQVTPTLTATVTRTATPLPPPRPDH